MVSALFSWDSPLWSPEPRKAVLLLSVCHVMKEAQASPCGKIREALKLLIEKDA